MYRIGLGESVVAAEQREGHCPSPTKVVAILTIYRSPTIIITDRKTKKSSGCRTFPAEIVRIRVLTREPDTVSTVGGKDAHMGYL